MQEVEDGCLIKGELMEIHGECIALHVFNFCMNLDVLSCNMC